MGRRLKGPVQLHGGDTWYARLWVPEKDRKTAGKGTLIRSLKTTSYSEALQRYGAAYAEIEGGLGALLKPKGLQDLREAVEANRDDQMLSPGEFASRLAADLGGDMLIIDEQPSLMITPIEHWRPKTLSSY